MNIIPSYTAVKSFQSRILVIFKKIKNLKSILSCSNGFAPIAINNYDPVKLLRRV